MGVSAAAVQSALESVADSEVSRINDESGINNQHVQQPLDANIQSGAQVCLLPAYFFQVCLVLCLKWNHLAGDNPRYN